MPSLQPVKEQLWARVYADALKRGETWFKAAELADTSVGAFDRSAALASPPASGERKIAGALFDFAGFLTSHPEVMPCGASAEASPMVDRLTEWAAKRGLSLDDPAINSWSNGLARAAPSQSAVQPLSEAQRVPLDEWRVMKMAKDAGFNLEPTANMLYTVRGNAAQVINLVHAVEAAHGIVTKEGT